MTEAIVIQGQLLGAEKCHEVIGKNIQGFYELGMALMEIRDQKYYKSFWGYDTFETYCREEWEISRMYAHYQIEASRVVLNVNNCLQIPATESQARPLTFLEPKEQKEVWEMAVETAPDGKITAKHVAKTVEEYKGKEERQIQQGGDWEKLYRIFLVKLAQERRIIEKLSVLSEWKDKQGKIMNDAHKIIYFIDELKN